MSLGFVYGHSDRIGLFDRPLTEGFVYFDSILKYSVGSEFLNVFLL